MSLRVLSLGAGVQSTTVLLLALSGEIEPIDAAIFADTGWEPRAVYAHLAELERRASESGVPVYRVVGGHVKRLTPLGTGGALDVPFHVSFPDGGGGISRRQCTTKLKIAPIRRKLRELMCEAGVTSAVQLFGISLDELHRMRDPDVKCLRHEYPLIELRWTRNDCKRYLATAWSSAVPRSACIGCPYRNNHDWRELKRESPDEFADAIAWEREIQRHGLGIANKPGAIPFVHYSRVPLDQVDLSVPEDHGQLTLDDECQGMCGV